MLTRQITQIRSKSRIIRSAADGTRRTNIRVCQLLLACLAMLFTTIVTLAQPPAASKASAPLSTGAKFADAIQQPLSLNWTDRPLRVGFDELSKLRQVSILLDRRLDPSSLVTLQANKVGLLQIARQAGVPLAADVSVVGNVVYLGPRSTARRLRTMVDLRHQELLAPTGPKKTPTAQGSAARTTRYLIQWDDLTTPTEVLKLIAQKYELQLEGQEAVPHDLWVACSLPSVTSAEALQLVLGQFDLSFEWATLGKTVRIVPLPESPRIERTYDVGTKAAQLAKSLTTDVPEATVTVKDAKLIVTARSEEHDQVDAIIHPNRPVTRPTNSAPPQILFTFEVKNVRLIDFMQNFEKQSEFRFEYDADELEKAGVKLTREVTLKMQRAKPAELFRAMFADAGVEFEIDGLTVKLRPK